MTNGYLIKNCTLKSTFIVWQYNDHISSYGLIEKLHATNKWNWFLNINICIEFIQYQGCIGRNDIDFLTPWKVRECPLQDKDPPVA